MHKTILEAKRGVHPNPLELPLPTGLDYPQIRVSHAQCIRLESSTTGKQGKGNGTEMGTGICEKKLHG